MKNKKLWYGLYSAVVLGGLLIPLAGMTFYENQSTGEKRVLAPFPMIEKAGKMNVRYLNELGAYFEDHFAFRSELVSANAALEAGVFGVSAEDSVILGKDGWLYYADSLDDYLGRNVMSDREIYNAVHTLELIQEYMEKRGGQFLFTVAPNKSSLYPEYMPDYYKKITPENNLARLTAKMKEAGISYLDLKAAFDAEDEVLYHRLDSHWNNKGAVLAMNAILDTLGKEHDSYEDVTSQVEKNFDGDLYGMLYPNGTEKDENVIYDKFQTFAYVGDVKSTDDMFIQSVNPAKEGNLVMFRDSFGNALTPFMADEYADAYFSRSTPYQVDEAAARDADALVFEIVERHLDILAKQAPRMAAPERELAEGEYEESAAGQTLVLREEAPYLVVTGHVPENISDAEGRIYVSLTAGEERKTFEAFPVNSETGYGYGLYILPDELEAGDYSLEVVTEKDGTRITSGAIEHYTKE